MYIFRSPIFHSLKTDFYRITIVETIFERSSCIFRHILTYHMDHNQNVKKNSKALVPVRTIRINCPLLRPNNSTSIPRSITNLRPSRPLRPSKPLAITAPFHPPLVRQTAPQLLQQPDQQPIQQAVQQPIQHPIQQPIQQAILQPIQQPVREPLANENEPIFAARDVGLLDGQNARPAPPVDRVIRFTHRNMKTFKKKQYIVQYIFIF